MELKKLFGLPAHPLVVHLPIVLIPLAAVGAIAIAVRPAWRARFGWVLVGLAGISLVGVQLAMSSGEGLEDHVERSQALHTHTHMAESMRPLAALFFLGLLALVWFDHRRRDAKSQRLLQVLAAVVVLLSLATTARLVQVGHNGAKATWADVKLEGGESHEGDGDGD